MTYDHGILFCKSVEPFFSMEYEDVKPNTIRVVPIEELVALSSCTKVSVVHAGDDTRGFERWIESVVDITDALVDVHVPSGYRLVLISWRPA